MPWLSDVRQRHRPGRERVRPRGEEAVGEIALLGRYHVVHERDRIDKPHTGESSPRIGAGRARVERELADLRDTGFDDIVLDLRALTFIDSSGLDLLLSEHRLAQAAGHRFRLISGSGAALRLLELTGTGDAFDLVGRT